MPPADTELVPTDDDPLEAGDELLFLCTAEVEDEIERIVSGEG